MAIKGFKRNFDPLQILSETQLEAVYNGIIQVLTQTGVNFHDVRALDLFAEKGCDVDFESKRVRFSENIIRDCLAASPASFEVVAREPENNVTLGLKDVSYFSPSPGKNSVDLDSWEPREPTRAEFYDYIKILDFLPNVHRMPAFPFYGFKNVPECMRLIESNAAKIRNSSKVQTEGSMQDNHRWNIQMAKVTGQDLLSLANPAPPLTFYEETISKVYNFTSEGVPFHFASGPLAGATGPATIAGSLVTNCAEAVAGVAFSQLLKPGSRIWIGNMTMIMNMKTGSPAFGAIENSLNEVMFNQLFRKLEIPTWSSASAWTSSKAIDFQAASETSMSALLCALSGASFVLMQGGLTGELTAHPVKAILDDEIAGSIGRFLRGVDITDKTLALDVINEIGPIPGQFLNNMHTFETWKQEQYLPPLADRLSFDKWIELGKKKVIDLAREKMEEIKSNHKPTPLSSGQEQEIEDILKDARQYYRKKGLISDDEWAVYQKDIHSPNYPYA